MDGPKEAPAGPIIAPRPGLGATRETRVETTAHRAATRTNARGSTFLVAGGHTLDHAAHRPAPVNVTNNNSNSQQQQQPAWRQAVGSAAPAPVRRGRSDAVPPGALTPEALPRLLEPGWNTKSASGCLLAMDGYHPCWVAHDSIH